MTPRLYTHRGGLDHLTGPGHPERPERLRALLDLFREAPFRDWPLIEAEQADRDYVLRAHDAAYLGRLEDMSPDRDFSWIDDDTILSPGSLAAAFGAAGAVRRAVNDVMGGAARRAFCAVRPPGHHAFPDHAEGFCFFNNAMLGALHAQGGGATRVAVLDFDVHHGNGSDAMARRHDGIFYGSTHQSGIYPGTGVPANDVPGRIVNVPLAAFSGGDKFRKAWGDAILPQAEAFAPDLVIVSAGFDAHRQDPLAQLKLEDEDFSWITERLAALADRHARGRIVSVLEGGYDLAALTGGVAAHLKALAV